MDIFFLRCERAVTGDTLSRFPHIQVVNPDNIAGREHLEFALERAEQAFKEKRNMAKSIFVETVLRASGKNQISTALETLGIDETKTVAIIAQKSSDDFIREYGCAVDDSLEELTRDKYERLKSIYSISETEINAVSGEDFKSKGETLKRIIEERIALLDLE